MIALIQFLRALWGIPTTLRTVLNNPEDHPEVSQRLIPQTYSDAEKEKELLRLSGEAVLERQLAKVAMFERILASSEEGMGAIRIAEKDFDAFIAILTDIRLVMASFLNIEDEEWEDNLTEEQLMEPWVAMLHLTSGIQQILLEATGMVSDLDIDPEVDL